MRQIVDSQGVCRYITGEVSGGKVLIFPTLPQLLESLPEQREFPHPNDLAITLPIALDHIKKSGLSAQEKILDEDGLVCGILASGLLFPVVPESSHQGIESLRVYSSRVNPLKVN